MGSKEGIMHISMAFLNAGDSVLIPNPGYPTYTSVTNLLEAKPVYYELNAENNWLPDYKNWQKRPERCKTHVGKLPAYAYGSYSFGGRF